MAEICFPQRFISVCFLTGVCLLIKMLHLREVIASSFVTWPVLVSKTEGVETDSGRQHSRLYQEDSVPSCSYSLHHLSAFLVEVMVQIGRCESLIT